MSVAVPDEEVVVDEDEGPTKRFELRLSVQTIDYLKEIKKRGFYGRTVSAVVRTFIDTGVREAVDKKYIDATIRSE